MDRRELVVGAAAGALGLALGSLGPAARAGGIVPRVLVTADLESHVVALDLASGQVVSRLDTAPGPRSIETVGASTAIVCHTEVGALSILGAAGGLGLRAELEGFEAPRYVTVHPGRRHAYVTDSAREEVVVVDPVGARVLWRTRVLGPARHISVSGDGRTVWTALGTKAARVAVLDTSDPRRPRLTRTIAPPFLAHDVAFAPDGRTAWVTSGDENRIALYRGTRLARFVAAGASPQHVAFAREKVFVSSGDDGTVVRHRLDGTRVREARVRVGSYNVCFGWGSVVTPSLRTGTLTALDRNGRVRFVRKLARAAHDACIVLDA